MLCFTMRLQYTIFPPIPPYFKARKLLTCFSSFFLTWVFARVPKAGWAVLALSEQRPNKAKVRAASLWGIVSFISPLGLPCFSNPTSWLSLGFSHKGCEKQAVWLWTCPNTNTVEVCICTWRQARTYQCPFYWAFKTDDQHWWSDKGHAHSIDYHHFHFSASFWFLHGPIREGQPLLDDLSWSLGI